MDEHWRVKASSWHGQGGQQELARAQPPPTLPAFRPTWRRQRTSTCPNCWKLRARAAAQVGPALCKSQCARRAGAGERIMMLRHPARWNAKPACANAPLRRTRAAWPSTILQGEDPATPSGWPPSCCAAGMQAPPVTCERAGGGGDALQLVASCGGLPLPCCNPAAPL